MVSITIVTWNSARHLRDCLASVERQDYRDIEVIILDNASTDGTQEILREYESRFRVIYRSENSGFAAGQNEAMRAARGEWILCLNPDILMRQEFVSQLVAAGEAHPAAGAVCGKLLRWKPEELHERTNIIDSTGVYFTRNMRHLDRGAEEIDRGQYDRVQYVFAATGAAVMFRREFINAVSVEGEFFDEEFFSFREDGDLAWRAQLMGHKYLYTPNAVAWHVRRVTPERRKDLPHVINWHSVKNRWLMRAKNASWWLTAASGIAGVLARPAGFWLRVAARPQHDVCRVSTAGVRRCGRAAPQARNHSVAPPSTGSRIALVVQQHAAGHRHRAAGARAGAGVCWARARFR